MVADVVATGNEFPPLVNLALVTILSTFRQQVRLMAQLSVDSD